MATVGNIFVIVNIAVFGKNSPVEPVYIEVTFKRSGVHHCEYFKSYIELNDQDLDLRNGSWSMELKTREIVKRVGILDYLPSGIADDWAGSGRILDRYLESPWSAAAEPTTLSGRRVWVLDELKWGRLG
jgi:hypothetical protein